jgi:hypothetical protein
MGVGEFYWKQPNWVCVKQQQQPQQQQQQQQKKEEEENNNSNIATYFAPALVH